MASLYRPGGNLTGISGVLVAIGQKWLELVRDITALPASLHGAPAIFRTLGGISALAPD